MGKGVERLEMNFGEKKYYIQFSSTGKKRKSFMRDIHKLSVDVMFAQTTSKKVIKNHRDKVVAAV